MPPAWLRRVVSRLAPGDLRGELVEALDEGFTARVEEVGRARALLWYGRQALSFDWFTLRRECGVSRRPKEAFVQDFLSDLKFALRSLAKRPGFTAVVVLTLALGIGANVALVSVVRAVLLQSLPYGDEERLVSVWSQWTGFPKTWVSEPEYRLYRDTIESFEDAAFYFSDSANLMDGDEPERVGLAGVTANLFDVLDVAPAAGRFFTPDEETRDQTDVVLLSYRIWSRRYGADPSLVGRRVDLDGIPRTVVGVLPPRFQLPIDFNAETRTDVYFPYHVPPGVEPLPRLGGSHGAYVVARLAPEQTIERARAELQAANERAVEEGVYPAERRFRTLVIPIEDDVVGDVRPALLVLLGAVAFVLLIACTNVANVVLSRGQERSREIALRTSLGAGFGRVFRQLMTESLVLAFTSGIVALGLAAVCLKALVAIDPGSIPRLADAALDGPALGIALLLTVATAFFFGALPALGTSRPDLRSVLGSGTRSAGSGLLGSRFRAALVVVQVAMAVVLITGAGLMIRTFRTLVAVDPGFRADSVLTLRLSAPSANYPEPETLIALYERILERVREIPGVEEAGAVRVLPLATSIGDWGTRVEGYEPPPGENPSADWQIATPGYFEAMGMTLLEGRTFDASDRADSEPVMIVNESLARHYWPNESALGKRIRVGGAEDPPWNRIVGVVANVRHNGITAEIKDKWYRPHSQFQQSSGFTPNAMTLTIRTSVPTEAALGPVRDAVRAVDPKLPISEVRPLADVLSGSVAASRFTMLLLVLLSALALALAVVGVYGVASFVVSQRTREIGLRMALGASPSGMVGLVLRQGVLLTALGIFLGGSAAFALTRFMESFLYGVGTRDPITFAIVPLVLLIAALFGTAMPALRASRVDPVLALRAE